MPEIQLLKIIRSKKRISWEKAIHRPIISDPKPAIFLLCCLFLFFTVQGCAWIGSSDWVKRGAVNGLYPTFEDFHAVALQCDDLQILQSTMESWVLLAETLVASNPKNADLVSFASRLYGYYSFGFVVHNDLERARKLYWRGIALGKKALLNNPALKKAMDQGEQLYKCVNLLRPDKDIPAAFATALCQGMLLICSLDLPEALGEANAFKALCEWVITHDEMYFCAGSHSLIGVYYGLMPAIMGGGPEKARIKFKKAISLSPDFLLHYYLYARYVPTLVYDEPHFDELIEHILKADTRALPEYAAFNEIAKLKARLLEEDRNIYF